MEFDVTQDKVLSFRISAALAKRLKALAPKVATLPEAAVLGALRSSDVARIVLVRGIQALEAEASSRRT